MRYNDTYEIDIDGTVKNSKTGRILKTYLAGSSKIKPYKYLRLGVGKKYPIHRLVASLYLPMPTSDNCVVDHIDRNPLNNHASNLRWVSKSLNSQNRDIETKARTNNRHKNHHIRIIKTKRQITTSYAVCYQLVHFKFFKCYHTLEEAINKRNEIENELINHRL